MYVVSGGGEVGGKERESTYSHDANTITECSVFTQSIGLS